MSAKVPRERAMDVLGGADPAWAPDAEAAWDRITASGDIEEIGLHEVQMFLWYELPTKRMDSGARIRRVADSLANLLYALDLPAYAAVCRSETTRDVLAAWEKDEGAGYTALNRALGTSGVEAPDLEDFRWGDYMGIEEAQLHLKVSSALEEAIDSGDLVVGTRGWREVQRRVARAFLTTAHIAHGGRTPLRVIEEERSEFWLIHGRGEQRRELIAPIASLVREPIDPPAGVADALRPLLRLLELARDVVPLTERKNIAPAVVQDLTAEFGWWKEWRGTPRSEQEVGPLLELHELAKSARLVRHSKRTMLLTAEGRRALEDPERCWRTLVRHFVSGDKFMGALCEIVFAMLVRGPSDFLAPAARQGSVG